MRRVAMIQRYEEALFAQLAEQARGDVTANGGEGGAGGDSSGGVAGTGLGGAP